MISPGHRDVGPEILTGAGAGRIVTEIDCGVPVTLQELEGVTVKVYVPGGVVPQSTLIIAEPVVPFGVVKEAPPGSPFQV
jgi:hypothetical protein